MSPAPNHTTLFFAVLDGADPNTWEVFNRKFPELMAEAQKDPKPLGVPLWYLEDLSIAVQLLLVGPEDLLAQKYLDKVVGVIIDGEPKDPTGADLEQKLVTLKRLFMKQTESREKPLFKRFGYEVWFVTKDKDSPIFTGFVDKVKDALEAHMDGPPPRYDYIYEEWILGHALCGYLGGAYRLLAYPLPNEENG
jgi:hypothetical protein